MYLRGIVLNEAVTQGFLSFRIHRHPEAIFLNNTNLTINFTKHTFEFLKFLLRDDGEVIHHYDVSKPRLKLEIIFLVNIFVITKPPKKKYKTKSGIPRVSFQWSEPEDDKKNEKVKMIPGDAAIFAGREANGVDIDSGEIDTETQRGVFELLHDHDVRHDSSSDGVNVR